MTIAYRNIAHMAFGALVWRLAARRAPLNLMLALTDRCTSRCGYCAIPDRRTPEMSFAEIRRLLDEASEMGCRRLGLWGGEPLMREDLGDIVSHARRLGLFVTIDTNGHLIPERIEDLSQASHLNISLDGERAAHDAARGAGSFDRTVRGIETAVESGLPIWTITVLTRFNLDQVDAILAMSRKWRTRASFQVLHHGKILGREDGFRTDNEDLRQAVRLLLNRKREGAPIASSEQYLERLLAWPDYKMNRSADLNGRPPCVAGRLYCNVDADGALYPCSLLIGQTPAPNVRDRGFREAFASLPLPDCRSCTAACFTEYNFLFSLNGRTGWHWVKTLRS